MKLIVSTTFYLCFYGSNLMVLFGLQRKGAIFFDFWEINIKKMSNFSLHNKSTKLGSTNIMLLPSWRCGLAPQTIRHLPCAKMNPSRAGDCGSVIP